MTDLEMTRLCAEAMGLPHFATVPGSEKISGIYESRIVIKGFGQGEIYHPLTDDAQAMALVKKFKVWNMFPDNGSLGRHGIVVTIAKDESGNDGYVSEHPDDLNRAIVECVAKMQASKS